MQEGRRAMLEMRTYADGDHDAVWELHNLALDAVGAHAGHGPFDEDLHHIEETYLKAGGAFLVGVLEGRIVAMGALRRTSPSEAEITRMRVHPDFWRRGFGRQMLRRLEAKATEAGLTRLFLETTVGQLAAQKLYLNEGYVECGRACHFDFDVIRYEKVLSPSSGQVTPS